MRETPPETPYVREPGYAERYRDRRFTAGTGVQTDRRERRLIRDLLASVRVDSGAHAADSTDRGWWLDLPSGAGRLSDELPGRVVQVDRDAAMLVAAGPDRNRACASALRLPFRDDQFAGVLCMRLMQHLPGGDERRAVLAELARVTSGPIVVSYFDRASLAAQRRVWKRRFGGTRSGRESVRWRTFRDDLRAAGLEPKRRCFHARFVSEQCLVLAQRR